MSPIRIALIGLSSSAQTAWAASAHLPYLLSPRGRANYTIVALLNSSVAAAEAAIAAYNLPPSTKAYGSPSELAADPDVDLVVCNTRVDVHASTVRASIAAGKAVFCEWPLARDVEEARGLVELARERGVLGKTVIGLQGRFSPLAFALREIIGDGRIGRVVSSEFRSTGGLNVRDTIGEGLEYFMDWKVGGNAYTISFMHAFDTIQSVLGDVLKTTDEGLPLRGHFHIQHPHVKVIRGSEVVKTVTSDVPDLFYITGRLPESPTTQKGATIHLRLRAGQTFPGEPDATWTIHGEKGEIRVVWQNWLDIHRDEDKDRVRVDLHDFNSGKVEPMKYMWEKREEEMPGAARGIGRLYEAFAEAQNNGKGEFGTFELALERHVQLEELVGNWRA
ncbi:hypothetical protein QBC47DRAFT_292117 [Echria macrotheca]|uniref:Gfo/Idh/MocA-like oxidoreductase N-terminal domain-containing protein n=1 Tax=Echria macrotheca TaxID=438768 RepID=A0AAJ0BMJ1_9PEZI|nr:hypothetical protein QBC47DRAFT_292117 [Echria macrotheca]